MAIWEGEVPIVAAWNWVDWVLAVYVVFGAARGLRRGFVRGALGVAGLVAGVVLAYFYAPALAGWLDGRFDLTAGIMQYLTSLEEIPPAFPLAVDAEGLSQALVSGLAFAAVALLVMGLVAVTAETLARGVGFVGLGPVDGLLGLVLGAAKALAVAAIVLGLAVSFAHMYGYEWVIGSLAGSTWAQTLVPLFYAISPWKPELLGGGST